MKFLCTIPNVEAFSKVKHLCDGVVMTNKKYSSRYETSFSFDEILQIVKKCNTARMEAYLLVDDILTDSDIPAVYELINTFKDIFPSIEEIDVVEIPIVSERNNNIEIYLFAS